MIHPLLLQYYLKTQQFGHPFIQVATLPSTNQVLLRWLRSQVLPLPVGATLMATQQSAGQGQYGRTWLSEAGGIYLSVVLNPISVVAAGALTLALAWGVVAILRESWDLPVQIKWPNDIVIHSQKLGGLLIQTTSQAGVLTAAVVGLGLNVNNSPPVEGIALSTLIQPLELVEVVALMLLGLERGYLTWQSSGLQALQTDYEAWMIHKDRRIALGPNLGGDTTGRVLGIAKSGALRVQTHRGVRCLQPGEVTLGYAQNLPLHPSP